MLFSQNLSLSSRFKPLFHAPNFSGKQKNKKKHDEKDKKLPKHASDKIQDWLSSKNRESILLDLSTKEVNEADEKIKDGDVAILIDLLEDSNPKVLDLSYNLIGDKGVKSLRNLVDKSFQVKSLNLMGNEGITDKSIPILINLIKGLQLEDINVLETSITESKSLIVPLVLNMIKINSAMLNLSHRGISTEMITQICDYLKLNSIKNLKHIDLRYNEILSEGARSLFETLTLCNIKLEKLNLSDNSIDDSCMEALGQYLQRNQCVEELDIGYNSISDEGIRILSKKLWGNHQLKSIYIDGNSAITQKSYQSIIDMIRHSSISTLSFEKKTFSSSKSKDIQKLLHAPIEKRNIINHLSESNTLDHIPFSNCEPIHLSNPNNSPKKTKKIIPTSHFGDWKMHSLKTSRGKIPKVGIVLIVHGSEWRLKGASPSTSSALDYTNLSNRMNFVESLFVGCTIDRLMSATGIFDALLLKEDMKVQQEFKKWKRFVETKREVITYLQNQSYDFVLLLNIRVDFRNPGAGYGLPETTERETIRACLLASGGNMMFGDWGIPSDYGLLENKLHWSDLELAAYYDGPWYETQETERALRKYRYDFEAPQEKIISSSPQQGFAKLIRLKRYLRVISSNENTLPIEWIKRIQNAAEGKEFSEANIYAAWWTAVISLTNLRDLWQSEQYKQSNPRLQVIQESVAKWLYGWVVWYQNEAWEEEMMKVVLIGYRRMMKSILFLFLLIALLLIITRYDFYGWFISWEMSKN